MSCDEEEWTPQKAQVRRWIEEMEEGKAEDPEGVSMEKLEKLNKKFSPEKWCEAGDDENAPSFTRIRVTMSSGHRKAVEELTESYFNRIKDNFDEYKTNGHNSHLKDVSFEEYIRPVSIDWSNSKALEALKDHFLYGYIECLFQSEDSPGMWLFDYDAKLRPKNISVEHF